MSLWPFTLATPGEGPSYWVAISGRTGAHRCSMSAPAVRSMISTMTEFQCGEEQITSRTFDSEGEYDVYVATHADLHFHGLRHIHNDPNVFPAPAAFCVPKQHSYESMPAIDAP